VRKLLIALVILVGLAALGDWFLKQEAEGRVATQVAANFELDDPPEITIDGFPFILNALRGHLPGVDIEVDRLRREGIRLEDLQAHLSDVRFETAAVLSGKGDVTARRGEGSVLVPFPSLDRALADEGSIGSTPEVVRTDGDRLVIAADIIGETEVTMRLEGGTLVLQSGDLPTGPITIDLPAIGDGITYDSVTTMSDAIKLHLSLSDTALKLTN
jgi:LmeA-like phospholipid-binding